MTAQARTARTPQRSLWQDLACSELLLAQHLAEAVQRFGAAALGVIDLPPLSGAALEPGHLRAAATLLWARELESAGLPGFVEALAKGVHQGSLHLPLGTALVDRLHRYHVAREERFGPEQRRALYEQVFGAERDPLRARLQELMDKLAELGRTGTTPDAITRLQVVAADVARRLSDRCAGITAFFARDITAHIRVALSILSDPELCAALGGWDRPRPFAIIRHHAPAIWGHAVDPAPGLARARAGQQVLSWLADIAFQLDSGTLQVAAGASVVSAAATWQQYGGST